MAPSDSFPLDLIWPTAGKGVRGRRSRAPWRHGVWTPEEVALALHGRREELLRELRGLSSARGLPATAAIANTHAPIAVTVWNAATTRSVLTTVTTAAAETLTPSLYGEGTKNELS
jgi:hypothetical protein